MEQLCPEGQIERFCGSQVAMELGAQFHLTGTVTAVRGDSVYIVATLTDEMGERPVPPVSVRGGEGAGGRLRGGEGVVPGIGGGLGQ